MAARMVDAQAPGVAATLRRLPQVTSSGSGWPGRLLAELAQLRLLVAAHQRLAELPEPLAATVRQRVGYTVAADDVLADARRFATSGTSSASTESDSGNLITRRTWLWAADGGPAGPRPHLRRRRPSSRTGRWSEARPSPPTSTSTRASRRCAVWSAGSTAMSSALPGVTPESSTADHRPAPRRPRRGPGPGPVADRVARRCSTSVRRAVAGSGGSSTRTATASPLRGGRECALAGPGRLRRRGRHGRGRAGRRPAPTPRRVAEAGVCVGAGCGPDRRDGGGLVSRASVAWDELVTAATVGTGTRAASAYRLPPDHRDRAWPTTASTRTTPPACWSWRPWRPRRTPSRFGPRRRHPSTPAPAENRPVMTDRLADLLLLAVRTDRDVAADLFDTVASAGLVLPPAALPAFLELGRDVRDRAGPGRPRRRARPLAGRPRRGLAGLPAARVSGRRDRRAAPGRPRGRPRACRPRAGSAPRPTTGPCCSTRWPTGLGLDDVPFLESALSDRSAAVGAPRGHTAGPALRPAAARRAAAVRRAGGRPGPARGPVGPPGTAAVAGARGGRPGRRWTSPPARDRLPSEPGGPAKGQRAWRLEQIIQRAPLSLWENEFRTVSGRARGPSGGR